MSRRSATARPAPFGAARLTLVGKSRASSGWRSYSNPLLCWLNAVPDMLLVVGRKHSAGGRTKAGPRHFCPKLTSALFAISVHKFAILAPDVLALPSRSHNRAFLRSDVPAMALGFRGFLRATGTQSAAFLAQYLARHFWAVSSSIMPQTFRLPLCAGSRVPAAFCLLPSRKACACEGSDPCRPCCS